MANYQFFSEIAPYAAAAGSACCGWKLAKPFFKSIKIKDARINIQLPKKLKFSKLEINLTTEKI
jgi:hypothetical protein